MVHMAKTRIKESSEIERVWIDMLERNPTLPHSKAGKSIGHLLSAVPLFTKTSRSISPPALKQSFR